MIALDAVVRILRRVMIFVGEKVIDHAQQQRGRIRGDLKRSFATAGCILKNLVPAETVRHFDTYRSMT